MSLSTESNCYNNFSAEMKTLNFYHILLCYLALPKTATSYSLDQHRQGHPRHDLERAAEGERWRESRRHQRGHRPQNG